MTSWRWDIDMRPAVGQFCFIETLEGVIREGRITGVRTKQIKINKQVYDLPECLELNGDTGDQIGFDRIKELIVK